MSASEMQGCAMRWRFQYQTQLMQDGWLGMLRKREDIGLKGRGRGGGEWAGIMQPTANDSPGQSVLERHGTFANKECLHDKFIHSSPV